MFIKASSRVVDTMNLSLISGIWIKSTVQSETFNMPKCHGSS